MLRSCYKSQAISRPGLKGKKFVAYHKLFEYLASEYWFQVIGHIEPKPGMPPSVGHVEQIILPGADVYAANNEAGR